MKKEDFIQFFKFALIGVLNTIINLFVLYIFTEFFHIYYLISAVFAFLFAVTNSFIFNKIWTFKEKISYNAYNKYFKFILISVVALIVNLVILYSFTEFLHIYYLVSQMMAIVLSFWINFVGNKLWTFKK
jgi:dolichol-phosphate mannosyltransferase